MDEDEYETDPYDSCPVYLDEEDYSYYEYSEYQYNG